MSIARDLARGLRGLAKELNHPKFTWGQHSVACIPTSTDSSQALQSGGFNDTVGVTLLVLPSDLPATGPNEKQTIRYDGKVYRIVRRVTLPSGAGIKFVCEDYKGATS